MEFSTCFHSNMSDISHSHRFIYILIVVQNFTPICPIFYKAPMQLSSQNCFVIILVWGQTLLYSIGPLFHANVPCGIIFYADKSLKYMKNILIDTNNYTKFHSN